MTRRHFLYRLLRGALVTLLLGPCGSLADASTIGDPAALCDLAAAHATASTDVPLDLLRAIMLTESGLSQHGRRVGWPWAVNVGGAGTWHPDRVSARMHVERALAEGSRNIDIGCFQMNYRWHAHRFADLDAMLDPFENAVQAARFLAELREELGGWQRAAGAYHSRNPERAEIYLARLEENLGEPSRLGTPVTAATAAGPAHTSEPRPGSRHYPLMVAGPGKPGPSLVHIETDGPPLIAAARRPLFDEG